MCCGEHLTIGPRAVHRLATYTAGDLTMTNIVHPSTVHRKHLCGDPT